MAQTTAKNGPGFPGEACANSPGIKLTGNPPFFADAWRCPELKQISLGRYRATFLPLNRYLGECTVMLLIFGGAVALLGRRINSVWALLPGLIIAMCYAWMGFSMMRRNRTHRLEFRDGELWAGAPELTRIGRVSDVIILMMPREEDEWRRKNGSWRIYLRLGECEPSHAIFPLVITEGQPLEEFGREIAAAVKCPLNHKKGRSEVPVAA